MSISVSGSGPSITVDGSGSTIAVTVTTGGGSSGGVTDHGALTGLSDDDHAIYALADGSRGDFGDVTGPDGATAGNLPVLDATGKVLSDSGHAPADFDRTSMALASSLVARSSIDAFDDFSKHDDGSIHGEETIGQGRLDPVTWTDGRTLVGAPVDAIMEVATIEDGVLRHQGTRLVAVAVVDLPDPGGFAHAASAQYAEETAGPGGGYSPYASESGYAASRLSFNKQSTSNGYVAYLEQADDESDHDLVIVRDDAGVPTELGSWSIGRRATTADHWTFSHHGNTFAVHLNGELVGTVTDSTYSYTTFDNSSIILNSASLWLPGVASWSIGRPAEVHAAQVTSGQLDVARVASGTATEGHVPTVDSDGQLELTAPSGGGDAAAIVWTEVASYVTNDVDGPDDWPEFTGIPEADFYRVRVFSDPGEHGAGSGGLTREIVLNLNSDSTSGNYLTGTTSAGSSDTKLNVGGIGQAGAGVTEAVFYRLARGTVAGTRHAIAMLANGIAISNGNVTSGLRIGRYSPDDAEDPIHPATWTFGISGSSAWAAGITFAIDTGVRP